MAKRTTTASRKKVNNKNRPKTKASGAAKPRAKSRGNHNRAYVLVIMGLLTVLLLLVNKFYEKTIRVPEIDHSQKNDRSVKIKEPEPEKEPVKKIEKKDREVKTDTPEIVKKDTHKIKDERPQKEDIKVYFIQFNDKTEKMYLSSVGRNVEKKALFENTMKELIKGPTASEKKKGLLSAMPSDLKLNSARIKNKTVELDFNSAIERGASGSVLINRIDQIVYTATQFPNVKSVIIKINGRKQETLGSDGLSIGGPLHRR